MQTFTYEEAMAEAERDHLLQEREKTHGSFSNNARMWTRFCKSINSDEQMQPEQRLALSMIFLKIARAHEQPNVKDHWRDISGYSLLAMEACTDDQKVQK